MPCTPAPARCALVRQSTTFTLLRANASQCINNIPGGDTQTAVSKLALSSREPSYQTEFLANNVGLCNLAYGEGQPNASVIFAEKSALLRAPMVTHEPPSGGPEVTDRVRVLYVAFSFYAQESQTFPQVVLSCNRCYWYGYMIWPDAGTYTKTFPGCDGGQFYSCLLHPYGPENPASRCTNYTNVFCRCANGMPYSGFASITATTEIILDALLPLRGPKTYAIKFEFGDLSITGPNGTWVLADVSKPRFGNIIGTGQTSCVAIDPYNGYPYATFQLGNIGYSVSYGQYTWGDVDDVFTGGDIIDSVTGSVYHKIP